MRGLLSIHALALSLLIVGCSDASPLEYPFPLGDRSDCIVRFDLLGDLHTSDAVIQLNNEISETIGDLGLHVRYRIASEGYNPPHPEYFIRYAEDCDRRYAHTRELLEILLQQIGSIEGYKIYEGVVVNEKDLIMRQGQRWGPP
ncbi:hypothetical protein B1C78_02895 [Thioalkalivibrio denitrificans]|uniref:Lipoprotein n=1 Tax=Thioalkalivibrio denitrificans TaxID=108003 RepID=A0A1V3NRZ1_9GAMM|nr:hypothetical protein B1C78_02895 [Thioalkalivibrio denitrificans]